MEEGGRVKKMILFAVALLAVSGCTNEHETRVLIRTDNHCTSETVKERADFILQCVENANPKSDEEPEDWIRDCQRMAEDTFCESRVFEITQVCGHKGGCLWFEESRKLKDS